MKKQLVTIMLASTLIGCGVSNNPQISSVKSIEWDENQQLGRSGVDPRTITKQNFKPCDINWFYHGPADAKNVLQSKGYKFVSSDWDYYNRGDKIRNYLEIYSWTEDTKPVGEFDMPTLTETCRVRARFHYNNSTPGDVYDTVQYFSLIGKNFGPNLPGTDAYCGKAKRLVLENIPSCHGLEIVDPDFEQYYPGMFD